MDAIKYFNIETFSDEFLLSFILLLNDNDPRSVAVLIFVFTAAMRLLALYCSVDRRCVKIKNSSHLELKILY